MMAKRPNVRVSFKPLSLALLLGSVPVVACGDSDDPTATAQQQASARCSVAGPVVQNDEWRYSRMMAIPPRASAETTAAARDAAGNVYVVGNVRDGGFNFVNGQTAKGSSDIFVTKYTRYGARRWLRLVGSKQWDIATAAVLHAGSVYFYGSSSGNLGGGQGPGLVLGSYRSSGAAGWLKMHKLQAGAAHVAVGLHQVNGKLWAIGQTFAAGKSRFHLLRFSPSSGALEHRSDITSLLNHGLPGWLRVRSINDFGADTAGRFYLAGELSTPKSQGVDTFVAQVTMGGKQRPWLRRLGLRHASDSLQIHSRPDGTSYVALAVGKNTFVKKIGPKSAVIWTRVIAQASVGTINHTPGGVVVAGAIRGCGKGVPSRSFTALLEPATGRTLRFGRPDIRGVIARASVVAGRSLFVGIDVFAAEDPRWPRGVAVAKLHESGLKIGTERIDPDGDEVFGESDNCPLVVNPAQRDGDRDGIGDRCDTCLAGGGDVDRDGVQNPCDNCVGVHNPKQEDIDRDGRGNACDCTNRGNLLLVGCSLANGGAALHCPSPIGPLALTGCVPEAGSRYRCKTYQALCDHYGEYWCHLIGIDLGPAPGCR